MTQHTNALIKETSPYLLQHAHNPVDWMPWGEETFEMARAQNKLVIVSIGYSSCHWCHVMERESFEDSVVAKVMNEHFISIKVDREERPDVDQVYMTAVQLMTGQGGWPLNVVTLPDGRPVYGGTYFPKESWMEVLGQVQEMYATQPEKVEQYAQKLTAGVQQTELVEVNTGKPDFSKKDTQGLFANWKLSFDKTEGGPDRAPRFPLPNNYEYLLQYGHLAQNEEALAHVQLTLKKMAYGGIYDQVGGGFARYSTDEKWKVPHFEKMLYDNAQLVSLYSKAFQKFKDPLYQQTVNETLEWTDREMTGPDGEFYSALDADSEGEEGKFYVWEKEELQQLIPQEEWKYFESYYNINAKGKWENGQYILLRSDEAREEFKLPDGRWEQLAGEWKKSLLKARDQRVRPALDDKSLTSWNALMITGLVNAYKAFAHEDEKAAGEYLQRALRNAQWLLTNQVRKDGSLYHSYRAGTSSIDGLIEDYAFSIQAFLKLYEVTSEEKYLRQADSWMAYAKKHFEDTATGLFYTRSLHSTQLIAKSLETTDNVIPAANSVMAQNLFALGLYLDKSAYSEQATHMLNQVNKDRLLQYGENYSNWAQLLLKLTYPHFEVAIAGNEAKGKYLHFQESYVPNVIWAVSEKENDLPLLENRFVPGTTKIYVCQDRVCQLPVEEVKKALEQMTATE